MENIQSYVKAAIVLHNYLRQTENAIYCPVGFFDAEVSSGKIKPGHWREILTENKNALLQKLIRCVAQGIKTLQWTCVMR